MQPEAARTNGMEDAELVRLAQEGDAEAFAELVARHESSIFRLARNITQNAEDAEDVLQETFLKAYEHLGEFRGDSKFYTWLVRIAVNQALMKLRRRKSDRSVSLDETFDTGEETLVREIAVWTEDPEQLYSQEELRRILASAIESLPPIFRTVFALRDIEELSTE
ncbi:MAG: sigma-70 family RNA polymerase sigma factor, partial [Bryobacterales bacterium]|nr:sigma-70 family RNA polymerase sigma factor [Bryobacteraceae bacterium]MDW8129718.1 sigma-70 family RNA polymerase sigma factor [Bryobacterales bacterium]